MSTLPSYFYSFIHTLPIIHTIGSTLGHSWPTVCYGYFTLFRQRLSHSWPDLGPELGRLLVELRSPMLDAKVGGTKITWNYHDCPNFV